MKRRYLLSNFYEHTWMALLSLSLLLVFISRVCSPFWILLIIGASLGALIRGDQAQPLANWERALAWAIVAVGLALGFVQFKASRDILNLFLTLFLGLLPMGLRRIREARSAWLTSLLTFLMAIASLLGGDTLFEYVLFIFYTGVMLFHLNSSYLYFHAGTIEARRQIVPPRYFGAFLTSVVLGTSVGVLFFFLFPRSLQWQNPFGMREKDTSTGYTGMVSLGTSLIRESEALAMTVVSDDVLWLAREGPTLLFRGNTLGSFDGVEWSNPLRPSEPYQNPFGIAHARTVGPIRRLTIYRELHSAPGLLYPGVLRDLEIGARSTDLLVDHYGNIRRSVEGHVKYRYELGVAFTDEESAKVTLPPRHRPFPGESDLKMYLTVPAKVAKSAYFPKWLQGIPVPKKSTTLDLMSTLQLYFETNYSATYAFDAEGKQNLATFLMRDRKGHCEYFATAAVMFLRHHGVPARLAAGYRGGLFNEVSKVLEVRELNAHAWVEIFVSGVGWIPYDPTPTMIRPMASTVVARLRWLGSAMQFWFQRFVVDYNTQSQLQVWRDLASMSWKPSGNAKRLPKMSWLGFALLALILAAVFWRLRRPATLAENVPSYYRLFLSQLRRKGISRKTGETFAVFHSRLKPTQFRSEILKQVANGLERDFYSSKPLDESERRELEKIVRDKR